LSGAQWVDVIGLTALALYVGIFAYLAWEDRHDD